MVYCDECLDHICGATPEALRQAGTLHACPGADGPWPAPCVSGFEQVMYDASSHLRSCRRVEFLAASCEVQAPADDLQRGSGRPFLRTWSARQPGRSAWNWGLVGFHARDKVSKRSSGTCLSWIEPVGKFQLTVTVQLDLGHMDAAILYAAAAPQYPPP